MDKQYYRDYFTLERNHWWFQARLSILQQLLKRYVIKNKENRPVTILNVGAGTGLTTEMLMQFGEVVSIEYDADCCAMVKEKLGLEFIQASITELPFEHNSFDYVVAFDVIEHIEDDKKATEELIRVCKPGGQILTTVPAFQMLWSRHDEVNHHYRRYTAATYRQLWSTQRGSIAYATYFNFWLFPFIALARWVNNLMGTKKQRANAGSDFSTAPAQWANGFFRMVFSSEAFFLNRLIALPWGVSYLLWYQKKKS